MTSQASQLVNPQKITQLQCMQCNVGLQSQFMQWITESFKYKPTLLNYVQDEIEMLLGYAQYKLTIAQDKPQPGDFLQNIEFRPLTRKTKILWLLISVLMPYLIKKISNYASTKESQIWKSIYDTLLKLQKILSVLEFINSAIFIAKGEYRSLTQRVLGIKMKFIDAENKRVLNFSLMNRVLIWQIYQFFLKTILPHAFSFLTGPLKNIFYLSSYLQPDHSQQGKNCIFCESNKPIMPHQAIPCLHKACYYCLKTNQSDKCKFCEKHVQKWRSIIK